MKSVLISTRPKLVEKICHKIGEDETGKAIYEKRIEVRKTAPKEVPFKCYIYETKGQYVKFTHGAHTKYGYGRGKVIGWFICDKVDEYNFHNGLVAFNSMGLPSGFYGSYLIFEDDYESMCLSYDEVKNYGKGKTLYGWHISNLTLYDRPKELSEFRKPCDRFLDCCTCRRLVRNEYMSCDNKITRPPQSWCYVEDLGEEE